MQPPICLIPHPDGHIDNDLTDVGVRRWRTPAQEGRTRSEPPESLGSDENTQQTGGVNGQSPLCHKSTDSARNHASPFG